MSAFNEEERESVDLLPWISMITIRVLAGTGTSLCDYIPWRMLRFMGSLSQSA